MTDEFGQRLGCGLATGRMRRAARTRFGSPDSSRASASFTTSTSTRRSVSASASGATDGHVGISSVEEDNFYGKIASDSHLTDHLPKERPVIFPAWEMSASGLTGVWAEENTRASLWDAMERKETYATTGSRIVVRFFGAQIPLVQGNEFWFLLLAHVILLLGCIMRGL